MENPFAKLDTSLLGNILSRCGISDIVRMKCIDRALGFLLKTQSVWNEISEWRERNNEYGYSLIIFEEKNSNEKGVRAREVHLIKGGDGVLMLENEVASRHRRRLVLYEGHREEFNVGDLWHKDSKLPANESSVLSFAAAGDGPHNFMVMNANEVEWKWIEHEECCFTHPSLDFIFIMDGMSPHYFLKITSLLPAMPLPLRFSTAVSLQLNHVAGTDLFDVRRKRVINIPPAPWPLSHIAAELMHVFQWGEGGITFILFVGDQNYVQVDLGCRKIEDMPHERLEFRVIFSYDTLPPKDLANVCPPKISRWLESSLLPYLYARATTVYFDQVEIVSTPDLHFLIVRKHKYGKWILVELLSDGEKSWGKSVRLDAPLADYIVSFSLWRFDRDCILFVVKLHDATQGSWWIVKGQHHAAVVVSQGMLQGITRGTRFSLVKHLHAT